MINAIINSIDDTANADVIELSVPDIYKASISSGSVNALSKTRGETFTAAV